tara:strand:+ start:1691 stop:2191 length:501 start_codon:yes stop_codon:yes gene_type:complete
MKLLSLIFIFIFLYSCSGFTPFYEKQKILSHNLKDIAITTDKKRMSLSIKKDLLRKLPPINNRIEYVLKIETKIENNSLVTDTDRKTSGYEIITISNILLYKREKTHDRVIFSFEEKSVGLFDFSPNQVLSTLASRNRVLEISSESLSKSILDRLMLYFLEKDNDS